MTFPLRFSFLSLLAIASAGCSNVSGTGGVGSSCSAGDGGGDDDAGSPCAASDSDGLNGGCYSFDLTVTDTGFSPVILKAQNRALVTLHLTNAGTKPHDFVMGCIPVSFPGCPAQSCFSSGATIPSLAPGASAVATFATPNPEGIYLFRSDVNGDSQVDADGGATGVVGQFVVQ